MASGPEQCLSRSLRMVLAPLKLGDAIPESTAFRDVLTSLEYFIPVVLGELHREWRFGGLDGVISISAYKTAAFDAEIIGLCILIADQTLTPIHVRMQIADDVDEISWLECRLGQAGRDGMKRVPYDRLNEASKALRRMESPVEEVEWAYCVGYGEKRC